MKQDNYYYRQDSSESAKWTAASSLRLRRWKLVTQRSSWADMSLHVLQVRTSHRTVEGLQGDLYQGTIFPFWNLCKPPSLCALEGDFFSFFLWLLCFFCRWKKFKTSSLAYTRFATSIFISVFRITSTIWPCERTVSFKYHVYRSDIRLNFVIIIQSDFLVKLI